MLLFMVLGAMNTFAQDADSLLATLGGEESIPLLPEKMSVSKRWLWAENGLMRKSERFKLTPDNRGRELDLRRKMLVTHQFAGYLTSALMVGTAVFGGLSYDNPVKYRKYHEGFQAATVVSYAATGALSLFSPPPLVVEGKKLSNIKVHRILAYIHGAGMITNGLFGEALLSNGHRNIHRIVGYTTAGALWGAMIVMKF